MSQSTGCTSEKNLCFCTLHWVYQERNMIHFFFRQLKLWSISTNKKWMYHTFLYVQSSNTAANISYLFWIKRWPPYCTIKLLYNRTRVYNTVWYIFQGFNANCSQFSKIYIVMYHTHAKRFLEFSYKHEIVLMLSWIVKNLIFHHHTLNLHVNFSLKNSLKVSKELYEAPIHKRWLKLILITIVIIKVATKSCAFLPVQLLFPMFDA